LDYPQPISPDAINLTPIDPGFSRDFDSTLGNAATDTDGFDVIFHAIQGSTKTSDDCRRQLDRCLAKVGSAFNDLSTPWEQEFSDSLTSTIASGDGDFKAYEVHLAGNNPPTTGGGAGSGATGGITIGAAAAEIMPCNTADPWPASGTETPPFTITIQLTNKSANTVQITAMDLWQPQAGVFSATTDCKGDLAPNASCNLSITQEKAASNGWVIQIQLKFATQSAVEVLCWQVGLTTGGTGGGGGGSGDCIVACP
jgi:hypothetical protein